MSINELEIDEFEFEYSFFCRKILFSSFTKMNSTGLDKSFWVLKRTSYGDDTFEYPKHIF